MEIANLRLVIDNQTDLDRLMILAKATPYSELPEITRLKLELDATRSAREHQVWPARLGAIREPVRARACSRVRGG